MKARAEAAKLSAEQVGTIELMYRRARTVEEQDQVSQAFNDVLDGWKRNKDAMAVVRRGFLDDEADDDEDPPALTAALERSGVTFLRT